MVTVRTWIILNENKWKIVNKIKKNIYKKEHFYEDDILNDGSSGLFGVLDGHGGIDVVEHVKNSIPKVKK